MSDMHLPTVSCNGTSMLAQPPQLHLTHVELGTINDRVSKNNNCANVNAVAKTTAATSSYRRQLFVATKVSILFES